MMFKWAKDLNRHFTKGDIQITYKLAHEKMFNIISHSNRRIRKCKLIDANVNHDAPIRMAKVKNTDNSKC